MGDKPGSPNQIISLPKGGGALSGIGETFSPDLHTGTGNFTVPIALPPGRNGFQPQLNLVYSTGSGNGEFGLGWSLSIPGVSRKTSKGVPRYEDKRDVFLLSGAEDLVPISGSYPGRVRYRPRTEGLFALIERQRDPDNDFWEVHSKDGLVSTYGGPRGQANHDSAVVADPARRDHIFAWKLTETRDPFGNRIEYEYRRDQRQEGPRHWDQLYLQQVRYVDYADDGGQTRFLVTVDFVYQDHPDPADPAAYDPRDLRSDPFSEYRSGFEIRTRLRCKRIIVKTHAGASRTVRKYRLGYENDPYNGVSLLKQLEVIGYDDAGNAYDAHDSDPGPHRLLLPPLTFGYTRFEPDTRRTFGPLLGDDLPARSLSSPDLELVDLFGHGLPDILQMNGVVRYWRNLGDGRFDLPRPMHEAPAGLALADPGVQLIDANGDGRTDLLVTTPELSGYFPLQFGGLWDRRSFRRYEQAPGFNLEDPEVKLVDLDGDGVTDAIRSGSRLECFYNDPHQGWNDTRWVERRALEEFPNINFSDPRVKWGDMSGDGLQDIALIYDGNVEYWPSLGRGNWGRRIHMHNSPRFPYGYDARRILVGDVDGDGLADIVYVDNNRVMLWINRSGNGWSDPIEICGTPPVTDMDAVRLVDLLGSGISGVLWSADATGSSRRTLWFLDFTGAIKPYLLDEMDNHMGATTKVAYAPSTRFFTADQQAPRTRWRTPLPFPVQVVWRVEVIDELSRGKLTTEYRYHHGYWDGGEREFRGFGLVEQFDTETFETYNQAGLHGPTAAFEHFDARERQPYFSPPTLTKTWFHQGPVGDEYGDWQEWGEPQYQDEYWPGDSPLLERPAEIGSLLSGLPRRVKRDALRALRGSILRSELYAVDDVDPARRQRPYTVTESLYGVGEVMLEQGQTRLTYTPRPDDSPERLGEDFPQRIFFPHLLAQRTTQWERGDDPLTQFSFTDYRDDSGQLDPFGRPRVQTQIACPRGWRALTDTPVEPYQATRSRTRYAAPLDPERYLHDRAVRVTTTEITETAGRRVLELAHLPDSSPTLKIIGQTNSFYDGEAFVGLPLGQVGRHGALTRAESLVLTDEILQQAYGPEIPPYLEPAGNPAWTSDYPAEFRTLLPRRAGYTFHPGSADPSVPKGYFVNTDRRRYDFQTNPSRAGRGMVMETLDPLHNAAVDPSGHRTLIAYDEYQLLPIQVTDAAGLTTQAGYNYRVLQPREVTDSNGNTSGFSFSPLGLLESSMVRGKNASEGDQGRLGVRLEYGLRAFENSPPENRQPIYVRTIRQIHHDTELDVPLPERDQTITTVEYSDGFGRLLQTRTQGEEVRFGDERFGGGESVLPAQQSHGAGGDVVGRRNTDALKPNVVVSGWQSYDNKGRVVEKYEPFYSEGWDYGRPEDKQFGQKVTMFYDPRGHTIRTLNPNGSEQRIIYGVPGSIAAPDLTQPGIFEPTPWEAYTYDASDNAGRTHPAESVAYQQHRNSPASILIDALGRTIEAVERNRDEPLAPIQEFHTRTTYDIRGNILAITDALGREAFQHVYDFANRRLRLESIDAGLRQTIFDAGGGVVEQRDGKGALTLHSCDNLNRPTRLWARDGAGPKLTLRERLEYGDAGSPNQPAAERASNRAANRLGRLARHFDEAGLLTSEAYDFKGNLLEKTRRVVSDTAILGAFAGPPPGWKVEAFRVDWTNPGDTLLDATMYVSTLSYDALNRVKLMIYPEDVEHSRRQLRPHYNRAGALERVALERVVPGGGTVVDAFVERIAYNAKGQRVLIAYGNGIMTRYAYDPKTFRLLHLRSERFNKPGELTYRHTGEPLQEFGYEYDLAGNILTIHDRTPGSGILNSPLGPEALDREFRYDALYRLWSATGRECDLPPDVPWDSAPRCADLTRTRGYTEQYQYDAAGNIEQLRHLAPAGGAGYTRDFELVPGNNRLGQVTVGATTFNYQYDANGNMTGETTSRHFEWDYADRMRVFRTQAGNAEPSVHAHYLYDAGGQRVKKLVRKQGGQFEVTVYVDGIFEHQRIVQAGVAVENNTLHVMDNQSRIALVRVGNPFSGDTTPAVKYHLGDHLGSSNLVLDDSGSLVNREEYTPYGETSFGSFARKRYRFSGKERDEESGLTYFGARYFAAWLGRWSNPDPAGTKEGTNLYQFVRLNPMIYTDSVGLEPDDKQLAQDTQAFNDKLKASDEKLTNVGEQYVEHVKQYQEARNTYEKHVGRQTTEENIKKVQQAIKDQSTAVGKLRTDEQRLRETLAERQALRTESKALEARQLASLRADWDAEQAAVKAANQQIGSMQGGRGGPWGGQAAPPAPPKSPRPAEVPTHFSIRANREALKATKESELLLAQTVRKTVEAAEVGKDLSRVVKIMSEVEAAEAASVAGRIGRLGKVLKIGGTVLFLADLVTGGANEAGVWDVTVGGVLNLGYETYGAGKAAVKSWLSIGSGINQNVNKYTRP